MAVSREQNRRLPQPWPQLAGALESKRKRERRSKTKEQRETAGETQAGPPAAACRARKGTEEHGQKAPRGRTQMQDLRPAERFVQSTSLLLGQGKGSGSIKRVQGVGWVVWISRHVLDLLPEGGLESLQILLVGHGRIRVVRVVDLAAAKETVPVCFAQARQVDLGIEVIGRMQPDPDTRQKMAKSRGLGFCESGARGEGGDGLGFGLGLGLSTS